MELRQRFQVLNKRLVDSPLESGRVDHLVVPRRIMALQVALQLPRDARGIGVEPVGIGVDGVVADVLAGPEGRGTAEQKDAKSPRRLFAANRRVVQKSVLVEHRIGLRGIRLDGARAERVAGNVLEDGVAGEDAVVRILKPQVAVPLEDNDEVAGQLDQAQEDQDRHTEGRFRVAGETIAVRRGGGGCRGIRQRIGKIWHFGRRWSGAP